MAALLVEHGTLLFVGVVLLFTSAAANDLNEKSDDDLPTRAPGEFSTLLQDWHGHEVAACRQRGNLYAYYTPLERCMPLLESTGSPCPNKEEVLVLNATSLEAQCMKLPCDVTRVLLPDGGCHTKEEFCDHSSDKELVLKETGYGTCDCPDLHVFWMEDNRCYAAYTRGPCAEGEYIVFRESVGVLCEKNPCAEEQVPWRGKCVPRSGHGCLDSKHGHLILNPANLKYECTLRCPDGMAEVDLDCYDLYTRGPCPTGQYIVHVPGTQLGRCADNPCGEDGMVPWDDKCWQRGQYCAADLPLPAPSAAIGSASEARRPQKREPVLLPDDDHLFILDRDDLWSSGPADGWVDSGSSGPSGLFGSSGSSAPSDLSAPSGMSAMSAMSGSSGPTGLSASSVVLEVGKPSPHQKEPGTLNAPGYDLLSVPKQMLPPPAQVPPGPAPPMRFGGVEDVSHLIELPSPHFGQSLEQVAALNSILPPPSQFEQSYYGRVIAENLGSTERTQSNEQAPSQPAIAPAPPHLSQPGGQIPSGHSVVPPPPQFAHQAASLPQIPSPQVPTPQVLPSRVLSPQSPPPQAPPSQVFPSHVPPPQAPSPQAPPPQVHPPQVAQFQLPPALPPQAAPSQVPLPQAPTSQSPPPQSPVSVGSFSAPSSAQSSGGSVPFLAHSYLPPPSGGNSVLAKRHTESASLPSMQLDVSGLKPFGAPETESSASRTRRSARLNQDTNARFAELFNKNGFVGIEDDHPFNGNFETLSAVQGLHINVNPLTYEVECSDAIGYYRTISFAHYKCRPGSRRDLLGECHHEGPDWTDYHPDRCPFGRRHNILTGKCMRIS